MTGPQAFEMEALPHLEALEKFAYRLSRDFHGAQDLVQETMLKALEHFDTFRQGSNCRSWLFQICKNTYINAYRRRRLEPLAVDLSDETSVAGTGDESDHLRSIRVHLADTSVSDPHAMSMSDEVMTALQSLPTVIQTAVILSDIEGQPYKEIAEFMRVPVGTVRSRIHRGRSRLAALLADNARDRKCSIAA